MAEETTYPDLNGDLELHTGIEEENIDDIEAMKARLAEMEKEAEKLKEMQDKVQKESGMSLDAPSTSAADDEAKAEVDARSVYVGGVDYATKPEELQTHFQGCGTINRVTILADRMGNPKGFAYIEFLEADAVDAACLLSGTELRGRALKVSPKRTNVPGMRQRGRGRGRGRRAYPMMPPFMMPWMWGDYMPRGRGRRGGYNPY